MAKAGKPADSLASAATMQVERAITFGKYTLTKRLGAGGMAEAFLAQTEGPSGFQKTLVIKRMLSHLADDVEFVRMFQREARLAALLTHTNVAQIYELGEIDGVQFIGMEYVDGAALHDLARVAWRSGVSLPLEVVCCAIADAALGLAAAHDLCDENGQRLGIVHRDISPDNLIMNREGVTKILDFGVAKAADGEKTATGLVKGKLPYLAPEQVLGRVLDGRTDLYALGVTFYGLVTGKRPFGGKGDVETLERILKGVPRPPFELNPLLPKRLNDLILRMLATDVADRPHDGAEVHDELVAALSSRRSIVVPFVKDFLSGALADSDPTRGPRFCHAVPLSPALLAWPRCENADPGNDDAIHAVPTMTRGNLISSDFDPETSGPSKKSPASTAPRFATPAPTVAAKQPPGPFAAAPSTKEFPSEATQVSGEATVAQFSPATAAGQMSRGPMTIDAGEIVTLYEGDDRETPSKEGLESPTLLSLPIAEPSRERGFEPAASPMTGIDVAVDDASGDATGDVSMHGFEHPEAKKRPPLLAAAAVVAAVVAIVAVVMLRDTDDADAPAVASGEIAEPPPPPETRPAETPPPETPVPAPPPKTAKTDKTRVVKPDAKADVVKPDVKPDVAGDVKADVADGDPAADVKPPRDDEPKKAKSESKIEVQARAPPGIQWLVDGKGAGAGTATLKVPAGTTKLTAVDKKRGGRSVVKIVDGVADFAALPRGKIHPRANPYAEVFLGSESLGTTPFAPIEAPVGSYTLKFVCEGKQEKRAVEVTKDATARVSVNFE